MNTKTYEQNIIEVDHCNCLSAFEDLPIKPKFRIGQNVTAVAFTDCSGKDHSAITGLTVTCIRLVRGESIPDYFRYTARASWKMVEGAERFFAEA